MLDPAVELSVVGSTWLAGNKVKFVAAPVINCMKEIQGKMV